MFIDPERKSVNVALRFLHLGLQIIAGYWAVVIDGYSCQEQFVTNVSYFGYALIGFNAILFAFFNSRTNTNKALYYGPLIINLGLAAGILYFTIEGYSKYNNCAPTKLLYEFFFIETIIAIVLFLLIMVAKVAWADRYSHWPGNLAWPILFLKQGFPGPLSSSALAIGILFAIISFSSFVVNTIHYNSLDVSGKKANILVGQWSLSMVIMLACEILAIVMLVTNEHDGDWNWIYSRKVFVVFAAVNIIDFFFWFYGYRRLSAWTTHTIV